MADVFVRGGVGIALALSGAGAYSLVGGYLAGLIALTASLWVLVRFRPRPRIVRSDLRGLLTFGGAVTALQLISAVIDQGDYLIVGKVLGDTALGLYTIGFRLPELFIINFAFVAGMVLFPAFAATDRAALASAYLASVRYVLMVCAPLAVGRCCSRPSRVDRLRRSVARIDRGDAGPQPVRARDRPRHPAPGRRTSR